MLGRVVLLHLFYAALCHVGRHHHHGSKATKAHAALLHVVQRTARLVNGTETEMLRCAAALRGAQVGLDEARGQMKDNREQMNHLKQELRATDSSINETAGLEAVLTQHLHKAEANVAHQNAKAQKLQESITSFSTKIEQDSAELAHRKKSLFDRVAKLRADQTDLHKAEKEAEVTRLALKRMHNWKHISQDRVRWEEETLQDDKRNHKRLHQSIGVELGEVRMELNAIEQKVQCWDAKRFLLAELLARIKSTKKEIAKKRAVADEDKARLQDLSKLLEHRAHERVEQMEQLKQAQAAYHDSLETVVKAQEKQLSEDKATIVESKARIKKLRTSEASKAAALSDAKAMHEKTQEERDAAQQAAADFAAEIEDGELRTAEMVRKRDEMLARLTLQREKELATKDQEISELVSRLNKESAARDAEVAEVAKLQGSLNSLRPAYESRGDALKHYEDIMVSQKQDLQKMRSAYDSTKDDLEQCLTSANQVDSTEAKELLEAVENTMAGQGYGPSGPFQEITGAITKAMEEALGSGNGISGNEQESVAAVASQESVGSQSDNEPDALAEDFRKLMSKLSKGVNGKLAPSSEPAKKPLQDQLTEAWTNVATSRTMKDKSGELPDALGEKVRALASELHEIHFGMAGLAGALDEISNL